MVVLSQGTDSKDPIAPVAAFRKIKHEELLREFKEVEQMARLRSGARGFDARKVLLTYEKKVQDSEEGVKAVNEDLPNDELERDTTGAIDLLGQLQIELETMKLEDVSEKARNALFGLGFSKSQFTKPFSSLSGGWKMRCLLAAAIVQTSDLLILDEPTNFLDLLGILWLQKFLLDLKENSPLITVVLVSHDRDFVNAITEETVILRDKVLTYFPGNIASYDKAIHREILRTTRMKTAQEKQIAHMQQTIINNKKAYKKTGDESKSRQAKSRQKRLEDRTGMSVSAKGTRFKLNRDMPGFYADGMRKAIDIPKLELEVELKFPAAPELRFPGALISLEKVDLKYVRAPEPTLKQVDLVIHRGDRVGILGLNGAGKSTLIKVMMETYKPTRGTVTRHPRLAVSYYSQDAIDTLKAKALLNPAWTTLSFIHKCATDADTELTEQEARGLLAGLGLAGRTVSDVPLCKLSGGQMVRVELARIFLARPHMLVLDEPTTHLDLPTVHALMQALIAFDGAVVLVSHDRALIRCVVEGDPVHEPGSSDESEESEDDDARMDKIAGVGRFVYELKGGLLTEVQGGVAAWEARVEKKLSKLAEEG